jgi:hypothetical protein
MADIIKHASDLLLASTVIGTCILSAACLVVIVANLLWRVTQH